MGNYTGLGDYRAKLRVRHQEIRIAIAGTSTKRSKAAKEVARDLLSGNISSKELAERGHPFAKRHFTKRGKYKKRSITQGVVPTDKLPINKQSGMLLRALKVTTTPDGSFDVYFDNTVAPYWRFVLAEEGTATMQPRGFFAEYRRKLKQVSPGRRASVADLRSEIQAIYRRT